MPTDAHDIAERPATTPWPPILLVGVIVAAIALRYLAPIPWPGIDDAPAHFIGLGIGALGLVLLVWSIFTLHRHGTTVLPDAGATELVTSGPYWRFRNPIYLGDTMVLLGAAELTHNVWFVVAAAVFAVLVTRLAILPEERHLEKRFGERYLAYKAKSRRWI